MEGWSLATLALPVTPVADPAGDQLGWCLGYPVISGELLPEKIVLDPTEGDGLEAFYDRASSRFLLVVLRGRGRPRVYLDAHGSLGAVYCPEAEVAASTTSLIDAPWNEELVQQIGFPQVQSAWLPCGLTFKRGVRRLQANHALDLATWSVHRHWPKPGDLSVVADPSEGVSKILAAGREVVAATAAVHPIEMSLTAGRDSRMLLACARPYLNRISFMTFVEPGAPGNGPDAEIARRLAKRHDLIARHLTIDRASADDLVRWQYLTGHALSGAIWHIHPTLRKLDSDRAMLPGIAGEVGRAYYWRRGDEAGTPLTAELVLRRVSKPAVEPLVSEMQTWLEGLVHLNSFQILDLLYVEHRLSCWAAPQHYGNVQSRFEAVPLSSRRAFTAMMRLPYSYRAEQRLATDVCELAWPELLELPFNQTVGLDWRIRRGAATLRSAAARMLRLTDGRRQ